MPEDREKALARAVRAAEAEFESIVGQMEPPENPQLGAAVDGIVWQAAKLFVVYLQYSGWTEASINKVGAELWKHLLIEAGFLNEGSDGELEIAVRWPER